ncbi:MAG: transposase [Vicinamibacterales bacterium]
MSRPMADTAKRRARRQFTDEFKASAVRLVLDEGKTVGAAARDLDLTETALRDWVTRARADRTHGRTGLTTAEREELARLRKENRILQEERDILKKAAVSSVGRCTTWYTSTWYKTIDGAARTARSDSTAKDGPLVSLETRGIA